MELKNGQFVVSGKDSAEGLLGAMREISLRLTKLNGNQFKDTGEPMLWGSGYDVRENGGMVQIGINTSFGWVLLKLDAARALDVVGRAISSQGLAMAAHQAQAEAAAAKSTGVLN